jgi:hypothetical protein
VTTPDDAELHAVRRARGLSGLPLAEMAVTDGKPVRAKPRVEMPGPSTRAKREAKVVADRSSEGRRGIILLALRSYGPMTRLALCEITCLKENSVNSACNALLKSGILTTLPTLDSLTNRSVLALVEGGNERGHGGSK